MTLSGVNRQIARNIVDYRRRIGGFRKIEDVALVSGVGASKLAQIRSELSVGPKLKSRDDGSSSMSSSGIGEDVSPAYSVDINLASTAEIAQVPLIGQTLAEHIVQYRTLNGQFGDVDDLLSVGGVTVSVLNAIRQYLTVSDTVPHSTTSPVDERALQDLVTDFRQMFASARLHQRHVSNCLPPVSAGLRLATWNLDHCSSLKMDNPGVREVVAMTILENRFSLVAVQGITDKSVLQKLCSELNEPSLRCVRQWAGPRGHWKYTITSDMVNNFIGLIYNIDEDIHIQTTQLADLFLPVNITHITVRSVGLEFVLVNMFLPESLSVDSVHCFLPRLTKELANFDETKIMFVGNLQSAPELLFSITGSVTPVIPVVPACTHDADCGAGTPGTTDDCAAVQAVCPDNIWLSQALCSHSYSGRSGVIHDGLTSPWIPNGWQLGGAASQYKPLWVDLTSDSH